MKTLKVWSKEIKLDIGDELKVKDLRKIYPLINKHKDNEIEMTIQVIIALSDQEDIEAILDDMTIDEMKELSEAFQGVMGSIEEGKKK